MQNNLRSTAPRLFVALLILLSSAACGSTASLNAATSTAVPTISLPVTQATDSASATSDDAPATAANPTETEAPALTATPAPTEAVVPTEVPPATTEPLPTATEAATGTSVPPQANQSGISGWCLPEDVSAAALQKPLEPPITARIGEVVNGEVEFNDLPTTACVFIYTFDQPAPAGLTLQVFEVRGKSPWLTAELKPVEGKPEAVSAVLRHTYIAAPPVWNVSYRFVVVDAAGKELRSDPVNLHRWKPPLCWNGHLPDPLTLRCPLPQDLHPWDPSYGTPIPTFPPKDD